MIVGLSYSPSPDPAFMDHMDELRVTHQEEVWVFKSFKDAEATVCRGRVQGNPKRPSGKPVTQVIVHNYPAPVGSGEPSPMTAVRRFNDCWGERDGERVLEAALFPEPVFARSNRDSSPIRRRHMAVQLT